MSGAGACRVAVTGLGLVSPLGNTPQVFFDNLMNGVSGVRSLAPGPELDGVATRAAAQCNYNPADHLPKARASLLDRHAQMALTSANDALAAAALTTAGHDPTRVGVYWGTGMGGAQAIAAATRAVYLEDAQRLHPFTVIRVMCNAAASAIAQDHGLRGPCLTYSVACASSAVAIGEAYHAVRSGRIDAAVAGGSESLITRPVVRAWEALQTLAAPEPGTDGTPSCRPFSAGRSGFVLGEGAACVVLEDLAAATRRGATILAEVVGYGASCDAAHVTKPDEAGQVAAMRSAMAEAGIAPEAVGYINAHGTATPVGDIVETKAIKQAYGTHARRLAVSSTKSMHGHLMGATGAVEFLATVMAVANRAVPPTANWLGPDPDCDLDWVPNRGRRDQDLAFAMSNSFAFGGSNAALLIRRAGGVCLST